METLFGAFAVGVGVLIGGSLRKTTPARIAIASIASVATYLGLVMFLGGPGGSSSRLDATTLVLAGSIFAVAVTAWAFWRSRKEGRDRQT
jgi:lipopolysaccharide export LptBFGC system permease protein LptF